MLDTANTRESEIFPVFVVPCGDDGKRKPFHIVHCLAQPPCNAELRLSPGRHSRLPPDCIAKFAAQKGWFADKHGYALCPAHKPGSASRPASKLSPAQKRAAFLSIRDRNLAAAAEIARKPSPPVGALAKKTAKLRAKLAKADPPDPRAPRAPPSSAAWFRSTPMRRALRNLIKREPLRTWSTLREVADAAEVSYCRFTMIVAEAVRLGFVTQEPVDPRYPRPFSLRFAGEVDSSDLPSPFNLPLHLTREMGERHAIVLAALDRALKKYGVRTTDRRKRDPRLIVMRADWRNEALPHLRIEGTAPDSARRAFDRAVDELAAMGDVVVAPRWAWLATTPQPQSKPQPKPEKESATMPTEAETAPSAPLAAEPPRQPTRDENRRIRDVLDDNYDADAGRWDKEWSDQAAADALGYPRAWVSAIRAALYGDDVNESALAFTARASSLEREAVTLKDEALAISARAEALEREIRDFLEKGK